MADIVNLGDRLKSQREATARLDLTAKMIPIMVETVEKFAAIGAKPDHIVRFLQATIDEITAVSRPNGDGKMKLQGSTMDGGRR